MLMIATSKDDDYNDGSGTTGDKVDIYSEGATGDNDDDDDNGDGTERRNKQIEAMAVAGGNNSH